MLLVLAQTMPAADWTDTLTRGGLLGAAVFAVWAFYTDRIVTGARHRRALEERDRRFQEERTRADEWKTLALEHALPITERALEVVKRP